MRGLRSNFRTPDDPDPRSYPGDYPPEDPRWTRDHATWRLGDPEVAGPVPPDPDGALTGRLSDEYEEWQAAREEAECPRTEDALLAGVRAELGEEGTAEVLEVLLVGDVMEDDPFEERDWWDGLLRRIRPQ